MAAIARLQQRIASMMQGGASLDQVQSDVIDPCELSSDQKAALWLFAWSLKGGKEQSSQATHYLLNVEPG